MATMTLEQFKIPTVKPQLDHDTFLIVIRAHNDRRHGNNAINYWAGICPVCWRKATGNTF